MIITALIGFFGGVLIYSFINLGNIFPFFILFLSIVVIFCNQLLFKKDKLIFKIFLILLFVALGMFRLEMVDNNKPSEILKNLVNQKVVFRGVVVDEPDEREFNTHLTVELKELFYETKDFETVSSREVYGRVLVTTERYPLRKYGDEIILKGKLRKPKNFSNEKDMDREFDYIAYLSKDNIYYQIFNAEIEFVSAGNGTWVKKKLFNLKTSFLEKISQNIPEPYVSLLGGLIVGAKQSLGKELLEDFRRTGLIHIVVLSGYNVSLVAQFVMRMFSFLPTAWGVFSGAFAIILFALMTGGGTAIIRASIMAIIAMFARITGRTYEATIALVCAGFLMIFFNPKILVFDISFQLSFTATLGLIYFSPIVKNYLKLIPEKYQIRELVASTIAVQVFVLPLLLYEIGDLSLVAIPVNFLVLIFIPITMLAGFLTGVFAFINTLIALPFAYLSFGLLFYEIKIVEFFSSLSFASIYVKYFPFWLMFLIYLIYSVIIFKWQKNNKEL